jgi:hypothetical protein
MSRANNIFQRDIQASLKKQFGNLEMFCFESWSLEYSVNPPTSRRPALWVGPSEAVSPCFMCLAAHLALRLASFQ